MNDRRRNLLVMKKHRGPKELEIGITNLSEVRNGVSSTLFVRGDADANGDEDVEGVRFDIFFGQRKEHRQIRTSTSSGFLRVELTLAGNGPEKFKKLFFLSVGDFLSGL
jgi:hypothetical protein